MGRPSGPMLAAASASVADMGADAPVPAADRLRLEGMLRRYFGHDTLLLAVAELVEFALWLRAQGRPIVAGSLLEIAGTAAAELGHGLSAEILGHGELTGAWVATFAPRAEPGAGQLRAGPFARFQLAEVKRKGPLRR